MNFPPPSARSHIDVTALSLMIFLTALWGLHHSIVKFGLEGISPIFQSGLRSLVAGALVWIWMAARGQPLFQKDGTLWAGLLAGLLFAGEFAFIYTSLALTTAGRAIVFLHLYPFLVALGAHFLIPGERLRPIHLVGMVAAMVGLCVAFFDGMLVFSREQILGDTCALIGGAFWGATTLLIKKTSLVRVSAAKSLFYQLAVSGVVLPILALALGEPGVFDVTARVVASFFYQAVVVCFASFMLWFWMVTRYPAGRLSSFNFLSPLFGILFGFLIWNEELRPSLGLAVVLVGAGIWLINKR